MSDADPVAARYDLLADKHKNEPLILFDEDIARVTKVPMARFRRMLLQNEWPVPPLPSYGLEHPRKGHGRGRDVGSRPCWSKYLVLRHLAEQDDGGGQRRARSAWQPSPPSQPRQEHQYVTYLKSRARWGK
jgi:hypothetical protein